MYLNQLTNKEKFEFLRLAHYIARIDGDVRIDEARVIQEYCTEMGVDDIHFEETCFDLEGSLSVLESDKSRKIFMLEIMVLVHSDDRFDIYQHKLIDKIASKFNMNEKEVRIYSQWGKAVIALQEQGRELIKP